MTVLCFDEAWGGEDEGDVQVAICARRRTVSKGNFIDRSKAEPANVARLQVAGFMAGSSLRYDFKNTGVLVEIKAGIVDVKNVIGMRCPGIKYAVGSVLSVPNNVLGS